MMLEWSASLLATGALVGLFLIALSSVNRPLVRIWWPGAIHGLLGLVAFLLLIAGLIAGPARGVQQGAGSFGLIAAVLVAVGLAMGGIVFAGRLRARRPAFMLLGLHATFGVAGLVMLAAYLAV